MRTILLALDAVMGARMVVFAILDGDSTVLLNDETTNVVRLETVAWRPFAIGFAEMWLAYATICAWFSVVGRALYTISLCAECQTIVGITKPIFDLKTSLASYTSRLILSLINAPIEDNTFGDTLALSQHVPANTMFTSLLLVIVRLAVQRHGLATIRPQKVPTNTSGAKSIPILLTVDIN